MIKLTADKCRSAIESIKMRQASIREEIYLQALEIALPVLEQKTHESTIAEQLECIRDSLTLNLHQEAIINCAIYRLNELNKRIQDLSRSQLDQQDGWISCSERIPEKPGFYICFLNNEVFEMYFYRGDCEDDKNCWLYFDMCGENRIELSHVTHWMKKPAPPQPFIYRQIENDGGDS